MPYGYDEPTTKNVKEYDPDHNLNQSVMGWSIVAVIALMVGNAVAFTLAYFGIIAPESFTTYSLLALFFGMPVIFIIAAVFRGRAARRKEVTGRGTAAMVISAAIVGINLFGFFF